MPKIQEYVSRVEAPGAVGGQRAVPQTQMGEALQNIGGAVNKAALFTQQRDEENDVSDVRTKMATARALATTDLTGRANTATPGDMTFAYTYSEDLDKRLGDLETTARTKAGRDTFKQMSAQLRADMYERATVHQANLAGAKAKFDYASVLDGNRNTLIQDPTQFERVLSDSLVQLQANRYIPSEAKLALEVHTKQQIALSAVQGTIQIDGALAKQQLESGKFDAFLDADNKAILLGQADQAIRARRTEEAWLEANAEKQRKAAQEATSQQFVEAWSKNELRPNQVIASNLDAAGKEHYLKMIDEQARAGDKPWNSSKTVMADLIARIYLPFGDPRKITNENDLLPYVKAEGGINPVDLDRLRGYVRDLRDPALGQFSTQLQDFYKKAESDISKTSPLAGLKDPKGDDMFYNFRWEVEQRIAAAKAAGKNPFELLDPNSKDYVSNITPRYRRTPQQIIQDMADGFKASGQQAAKQQQEAPTGGTVVPPGARTATNPKTGEKMYYDEAVKQWLRIVQ